MTKYDQKGKKYRLIPPKLAESEFESLVHGLSGSGRSIYNKDIIPITLSIYLLAFTMIDPAQNHRMV
jgi:hypothetical protein